MMTETKSGRRVPWFMAKVSNESRKHRKDKYKRYDSKYLRG